MDQTIQCLMRENYEYGIHLIVHRMGDKHSGEHLPFVVLEEAYLEKRNRLKYFTLIPQHYYKIFFLST